MPARIHLVISAHLCMSPRVQREAAVLRQAGHDVTISGVWFDSYRAWLDEELARRQNLVFLPALDLRGGDSRQKRWMERAKGRWARAHFAFSRRFTPALLGYGVAEQLAEAHRLAADLTIVHGEPGLWVAEQLLHDGRRVGVDFEDWFSRDLPVEQRRLRPTAELARLEAAILRRGNYRLASSQAMARALAKAYGVSAPVVVTNAGQERAPRVARTTDDPLRLHWFSQTIGPGRGLELLFAALPLVRHPLQVELRGACSGENLAWLNRIIPGPIRRRVTISPPVPPWELAATVAEHDVGLALETSTIPSRDVCIPNKFFQYLASGLAVIATSTRGHREAAAPCPDACVLVEGTSPRALAGAIERFVLDRVQLASAQAAARVAALGPWRGGWEREVIAAEAGRALELPVGKSWRIERPTAEPHATRSAKPPPESRPAKPPLQAATRSH